MIATTNTAMQPTIEMNLIPGSLMHKETIFEVRWILVEARRFFYYGRSLILPVNRATGGTGMRIFVEFAKHWQWGLVANWIPNGNKTSCEILVAGAFFPSGRLSLRLEDNGVRHEKKVVPNLAANAAAAGSRG